MSACGSSRSIREAPVVPVNAPRAFFLGIAGHDSEAVFENEIHLAHDVLDERFCFEDAHFLVNPKPRNDDEGVHDKASLETIVAALERYSAKASAKDVLVLYVASHGKRDGVILRNKSQGIDEILAPDALANGLQRAKVKEQVVFISACYSGVFVESLKNQDRALVTAADQNSPSFGCKASRELTFFGSAFWEKPAAAASLNKRYVSARKQIREWEEALELPSSNPLLNVGENVRSWSRPLCEKPLDAER